MKHLSRYIKVEMDDGSTLYLGTIYSYTLRSTSEVYVGLAADELLRRRDWNNPNHHYGGIKIHVARKQNGVSKAWDYSVLETVYATSLKELKQKLDTLETYWIDQKGSYEHGFNGNRGGKGLKGIKMSLQLKDMIRQSMEHPIIVRYADGTEENFASHIAAAEKLKVSESTISRYVQSGKTHLKGFSLKNPE